MRAAKIRYYNYFNEAKKRYLSKDVRADMPILL